VAAVAEVWRRGSVVASWPDLSAFSGRVSDSGEGRWDRSRRR
jgi:6-phosphogluconate dehydrogenase